MASPDRVLSTIGALNTLIENFPMSLLDLFKGKTYTSVFEFILDVLYACGVDVNEIISYLVNEIFSIMPNIEGDLASLQSKIASKDFTNIEQSPFLEKLEDGLKMILMTLLSSMFGCSAIPILPNKYMDFPNNNESFSGKVNTTLWKKFIYPKTLDIPIKLIDPMGILEITPTTLEGRAYYEIQGRDILYKKNKTANQVFSNKASNKIFQNPIYITHENTETDVKIMFNTLHEIPENIIISIGYLNKNASNLLVWSTEIKMSEKKSDKSFIILYENEKVVSQIKWIRINGVEQCCELNGNIKCHLSKTLSNDTVSNFPIFDDVEWGDSGLDVILSSEETQNKYTYEAIEGDSEDYKNAKRLNHCPKNPKDSDPELIIVYEGVDPNKLYQTFDMNAFIWYTLNKSSRANQLEINHTMWDSRLPALKQGNVRNGNGWVKWYNSKSNPSDEFIDFNNDNKIKKESSLYPILQLKKSPFNTYAIDVSFPSQRYFKPSYREKILNGENPKIGPTLTFNSSIYKFNWEYLQSIQILRPKLMLTGFVNYMLGFAVDTVKSFNFNLTKKILEKKIETAIVKIVEADDMETEDCYTSFSNEEFSDLLMEMESSRYSSTYYGGEVNKTKQHDINYYLNMIDSFNTATTKEESITKTTRLVNELISPASSEEGSINYGVECGFDGNLLKKLLWAITMPIVQSIFTPQVMLLIIINMGLTGVVKIDDFSNNDLGLIMNLLLNKILGQLKAIIKFVKDLIIELLLTLLMSKLTPLLAKYMGALAKERLEFWLRILKDAIASLPYLPIFNIKRTRIGGIDEVNYADIINTGTTTTPESASFC